LTRYAFDWVDAFSTRAFGGNACMVVHGADDISVKDRLALVNETSLSECAFVVDSDKADFGARYYLAEREILMAGHPTVATVVSLLDRGLVALTDGKARFTLEVGAGIV
jgi:PhzF family phenazine biosynthesis protein